MTFEEWQARGFELLSDLTDVRFQVGDWFNIGLDTFSAKDVQAVAKQIGWSESTIKVYSWVASQYPVEHRGYNVTFSHYMYTASLPVPARYEMLQRAASENLSLREVRTAVREVKGWKPWNPPDKAFDYTIEVGCGSEELLLRVVAAIEQAGWNVKVRYRLPAEKQGMHV